jgi:mRNA-degrading endonuclease RelE of RelBE toxin-antitoxin system
MTWPYWNWSLPKQASGKAGRKPNQAKRDRYRNYGTELMPNEVPEQIQVEFTRVFKRNLRALAKKYRHIRSDVQPVIDQLQAGEILGDRVPRRRYAVFKVRVLNSDIQKGKRSGYRLIYYLKTRTHIILVTIYSKLEQSDISAKRIGSIIAEFDR